MMSLQKTAEVHISQRENRSNNWAPVNLNGNALPVLKVAQQVSVSAAPTLLSCFYELPTFGDINLLSNMPKPDAETSQVHEAKSPIP